MPEARHHATPSLKIIHGDFAALEAPPDALLLRQCQAFHRAAERAQACAEAANEGDGRNPRAEAAWHAACAKAEVAGKRALATMPTTSAGLAAKARVARQMVAGLRRVSDPAACWDHALVDRVLEDAVALFGQAEDAGGFSPRLVEHKATSGQAHRSAMQ